MGLKTIARCMLMSVVQISMLHYLFDLTISQIDELKKHHLSKVM